MISTQFIIHVKELHEVTVNFTALDYDVGDVLQMTTSAGVMNKLDVAKFQLKWTPTSQTPINLTYILYLYRF